LHDEIVSAVNQRSDATHWPYISDRNELTRVYSAADLFVHAGDKETFGLVSLEAQACGVRVIAVKGGGMDETLEGETPQIIAPEATPEAFAAAVREAVALKEDNEVRKNRHLRMVNHFSWRATFDRLTALYAHLIDGKPVESFN
jgi:alpha-1,6-mannosyltransferase